MFDIFVEKITIKSRMI